MRVSLGWRNRVPEEGVRSLVPMLLLKLSRIMLEITKMGPHKGLICRTNFQSPSYSFSQCEEAEGPARQPPPPS